MGIVLRGLKWKICLVYLDGIVVMGKTFEEHQPKRSVQSIKGGKLEVEYEEMHPLPKRNIVSGAHVTGDLSTC